MQFPIEILGTEGSSSSIYDEDYEFNSLFTPDNYDSPSSLSNEILSYFDIKLKLDKSLDTNSETNDEKPVETKHDDDRNIKNTVAFDHDGIEHEFNGSCNHRRNRHTTITNENNTVTDDFVTTSDTKNVDLTTNSNSLESTNYNVDRKCSVEQPLNNLSHSNVNGECSIVLDSDEGSITSGCETLSVVTTTHCDDLIKAERETESTTIASPLSSILLPAESSKIPMNQLTAHLQDVHIDDNNREKRITINSINEEDSEFSDESGFDENNICKANNFNENDIRNTDANNNVKNGYSSNTKPMKRMKINIPKNAKSIHI